MEEVVGLSGVQEKPVDLRRLTEYLWEIAPTRGMRVPARIYATDSMITDILADRSYEQAANVAHLPGIVKASLAMPDIHRGYGFPIGGVAAFDADDGVISPGGIGYDINCGVRLLSSQLTREQITPQAKALVDELYRRIPTGIGASGALLVSTNELRKIVREGAHWAVERGYGLTDDLTYVEETGRIEGAKPDCVADPTWKRGVDQLGTLGAGNHFLEVGYVSDIYDEDAARVLDLKPDQVTVLVHTGSRGFGYQICSDYVHIMVQSLSKHGITLPDRQLACAPLHSEDAQAYIGAMRCAINYAFANRQVIVHNVRQAFANALSLTQEEIGLRTVYEVAHNIAKFETHVVDRKERKLCVHRKGATRAFGPGRPEIPSRYQGIGQPVLIPGDMARYSYVLVGTAHAMEETFGSTCHGAGRRLSRTKAKELVAGRHIADELKEKGILVRGATVQTINEEVPEAYKDVAEVVETCELAGISRKVARLKPIGVIKG